ncbi:HET-domain-containing protein [Lindgomyces ingoldianus]|uniref:HET-domain-containing protein n=1 Tax=Lindgomyces ingoldianus TaxID=673940 RepID=A0ACB6QI58_9PLEO|nr:HET-domain-containing protein [Lindgomyces ingoldianus]KAF2466562.1 HET-domain-containing protein [Lindgomyces ingoldianus]
MDAPAPLRLYQYRPLKSYTTIRVLVLQPAKDLYGLLKAQLVHVQGEHLLLGHGSPDYYEVVPYCWGEPKLSHVLLVNEDSTLGITSNADTLLRHLRSSSKPRYLWIDAICLNKEDRNEKQIQVQLMGRIYAQAAKARIWVGTATEHQHVPQLYNALKWLATLLKNKETPAPAEAEIFLETTCANSLLGPNF